MRNYLLDARFQLKYTGMVVVVTALVASVLGGIAYHYSRGQTESLMLELAMQPDQSPAVATELERFAQQEDRRVLGGIVAGIFILSLTLGLTGILVTHRVVGPAHKIKMLIRHVAKGHLKVDGRIRKGDELQDIFETFERMVLELRDHQTKEIAQLDTIIAAARNAETPQAVLEELEAFRARMQSALD